MKALGITGEIGPSFGKFKSKKQTKQFVYAVCVFSKTLRRKETKYGHKHSFKNLTLRVVLKTAVDVMKTFTHASTGLARTGGEGDSYAVFRVIPPMDEFHGKKWSSF